jgi:hypothetical protein
MCSQSFWSFTLSFIDLRSWQSACPLWCDFVPIQWLSQGVLQLRSQYHRLKFPPLLKSILLHIQCVLNHKIPSHAVLYSWTINCTCNTKRTVLFFRTYLRSPWPRLCIQVLVVCTWGAGVGFGSLVYWLEVCQIALLQIPLVICHPSISLGSRYSFVIAHKGPH